MKGVTPVSVCLAVLLAMTGASANNLNISPLRALLSAHVRTAAFTVANTGLSPSLIQVHLLAWSQVDGVDQLAPSDALLVGPPIFTVQPGQTQLVRIGLRTTPTSPREQTYRLVLDEVPVRTAGITFAFRLSMPVFITAEGAVGPRIKWLAERADATHLRLTLNNTGDQHVHINFLRIVARSSGDLLYSGTSVFYVLAGQRRTWTVPLNRVLGTGLIRVTAGSADGQAFDNDVGVAPIAQA
jgi:fimbrial chaperone protein